MAQASEDLESAPDSLVVGVFGAAVWDCRMDFRCEASLRRVLKAVATVRSHRTQHHRMHCHRRDFLERLLEMIGRILAAEVVAQDTCHLAEHLAEEASLAVDHAVAPKGHGSRAAAVFGEATAPYRTLDGHTGCLCRSIGNSSSQKGWRSEAVTNERIG